MRRRILAAATALTVLAAPAVAQAAKKSYRAEVRRTTGGWAHVKANDYGSLGFGYGYAYAQDQLCELADIVVTVNAQRSRYFGPEDGNLESDFFYQRIKDMRTVQKLVRRKAPHGPSKAARDTIKGFAAGYNAYLKRTGRNKLPDPTCRGKRWVRPITALDMYRRIYQLGLRASSGNFRNEIVAAEPPSGNASAARRIDPQAFNRRLGADSLGSNGLGIGRDGANGERALLLSNTHFPWQGSERWYEVHLTIPGKLNVIGASLQGVPVVNLGFTRGVAWSHTVSTARRFTPYELDLRRGRPTEYVVDGRNVKMRKRTVRVRVGGRARRHTFYETRWGPVFSFAAGGPDVGDRARLRARRRQRRQLPARQPVGASTTARSRSPTSGAPTGACRATRGPTRSPPTRPATPTTPTSRWCRTSTPTCSRAAPRTTRSRRSCSRRAWCCSTARARRCRWKNDRDALAKGIIGPRGLPRATRTDYVENSNDSYWLPSARFRLTGFPRIIGGEGTQRLLRTRLAMTLAEQRLAGTDGLGPPGFTLADAAAGDVRQPQPERRAGARHDRRRLPGERPRRPRRGVHGAGRVGHARGHRLARRRALARVLVAAVGRRRAVDDRLRPGRPGQHAARDRPARARRSSPR